MISLFKNLVSGISRAVLHVLLLATICMSQLSYGSDSSIKPEVEVMHWWAGSGDARAMRVIWDEFEYQGGIWHDVAEQNPNDTINIAISRMAKGYSPTLVQWASGWELSELRKLGLLNEISPDFLAQIRSSYLSSILDQVTVDDQIVAVPVSVHSDNWLWYRPTNQQVDEAIFESWAALLDHARKVTKSERYLLAVGDDKEQHRELFNNVLLGVAGREIYNRLFFDLDDSALNEPKLLKALTTYQALKAFSNSFGDGSWRQQILAVASGEALAVSMGDSAKSEFRRLGLKSGRDMRCLPAPGTQGEIVLRVEAFVLGQVLSEAEVAGQKLFLDIVTDRSINETFNYLKGSLPPLKSPEVSSLDSCAQIAVAALNSGSAPIKPFESVGDRVFLAKIENLLSELWTEQSNHDDWKARFRNLIMVERQKRNSGIRSSSLNE